MYEYVLCVRFDGFLLYWVTDEGNMSKANNPFRVQAPGKHEQITVIPGVFKILLWLTSQVLGEVCNNAHELRAHVFTM